MKPSSSALLSTKGGGRKKQRTGKIKIVLLAWLTTFFVAVVCVVVFSSVVRVEVVSDDESSSSSSSERGEKSSTREEEETRRWSPSLLPCDPATTTTTTKDTDETKTTSSSSSFSSSSSSSRNNARSHANEFLGVPRGSLCKDPERVDALIRAHACETFGGGGTNREETFDGAGLKAMPGKPSSSSSFSADEQTSKGKEESRRFHQRRRRTLFKNNAGGVEDTDPELENQEMDRVLERFRSGRITIEGPRNILYDGADDARDTAPPRIKTYKTCAVVGNSGTLQKTAYGAMIDSAEAVFRVNDGVAKRGCSLYAGSRTTVRVVDAKALGKMEILADDEEEVDNNINNNMSSFNTNETMVVLVNADDHERETIARSEYFNHAKSVKRMHEDIQDGAKVLMHSYREHLANIGKMQGAGGNIPSTGMITYYLALRLCDFVGLYGFGLYVEKERVENTSSGKKKGGAPVTAVHDFYRYYDAKRNVELGMRQIHSFDTERMLMSLISRSTDRSKLCGFKKDGDEDEVSKRIRREQDRRARQLARRTGRGKVKVGGSSSSSSSNTNTYNNNNDGTAGQEGSSTVGDRGVRVAAEKPIERAVDWDAHFKSSGS